MLQLSSDRVHTLIVFIVSLPMLDCQSNMLSSRVVRLGYEKSQLHRTDVKLVTAGQSVGNLRARRRGMSKSKGAWPPYRALLCPTYMARRQQGGVVTAGGWPPTQPLCIAYIAAPIFSHCSPFVLNPPNTQPEVILTHLCQRVNRYTYEQTYKPSH